MASRPVFLPDYDNDRLVEERVFDFSWASGFAEVQKKKNVVSLHNAAKKSGINNLLEISSKSEINVGKRLSAFSLELNLKNGSYPLESVYQGAKVFENCGPFPEIFSYSPRDAKKFIRHQDCGHLSGFKLEGKEYPLVPKNAFYDWIYIRSLEEHSEWINNRISYEAFTDIEFNPAKQVNCQARAFAEYLSLLAKKKLRKSASNFDYFASLLSPI